MDGRAGLPCGLRGEGRGGLRRQGCCLIRWKRAPEKLNMDENAVASTIEEIHKGMGAPLNYNSFEKMETYRIEVSVSAHRLFSSFPIRQNSPVFCSAGRRAM